LTIFDFIGIIPAFDKLVNALDISVRNEVLELSEIFIKYSGYIERELIVAEKFKRLENIVIDKKFNYLLLDSLSIEARQKLDKLQPGTIGQASRIPGVSPSDINVLLVLLGR
jgi:tRNA uridine 5-carboxymethylaminomethyl modification enzyme